ncbi:probable abnormal spindle-like microcephaly-associated protein homolog [Coccomyxa sp. Obi]|nr:probable abnormal spindle-like microcephaly-associated protein homolog [Coccomyxa sp. Obi]
MYAQRRVYLGDLRRIVCIQATWRGHQLRARFTELRAAAVVMQSAWRANRARRLRRSMLAAIHIQKHVRGHQLRRELAQRRSAAVVIQAAVRMHIQRNKFLAMVAMQRAMKEMYRAARRFSRRTAATIKIQALVRGFLARCEFRRRLAAKREREAAAMRIIAPWALTALHRCRFLALRRAAVIIQRAYRRRHARRSQAAVVIQAATRSFLASSRHRRLRRSAVCIQARWRGLRQRRRAGKPAAAAARRIVKALQLEVRPQATLAARTAAAVHTLQQSFHLSQVMAAVKDLQHCVYLSSACAEAFASAGGASSIVHYLRSCNRSAPHMGLLKDGLSALGHVARRRSLAPAVYAAEDAGVDCPSLMAAIMLQSRDNEEVYMSAMAILLGVVGCPERAACVAANAQTVKQLESLGQLLIRKLDMESKYLNRLEGEKGSDVSAREATRKMVAARRQLVSLHQILSAVPGIAPSRELAVAAAEAHEGLAHAPRNTIVRDVLKGMQR